jgi:hypothetical protein
MKSPLFEVFHTFLPMAVSVSLNVANMFDLEAMILGFLI